MNKAKSSESEFEEQDKEGDPNEKGVYSTKDGAVRKSTLNPRQSEGTPTPMRLIQKQYGVGVESDISVDQMEFDNSMERDMIKKAALNIFKNNVGESTNKTLQW